MWANQLTKDGYIVVKSDRTRSQLLNQADAIRKLRENIWEALKPTTKEYDTETQEKIRKGMIRAGRERLKEKRVRSEVKKFRSGKQIDEF